MKQLLIRLLFLKNIKSKKLARPLISAFIKLASKLGHQKKFLHTKTHTWLAAKLYLDFGFTPYQIKENFMGWRILKTITNHAKLIDIEPIDEDKMYSSLYKNCPRIK